MKESDMPARRVFLSLLMSVACGGRLRGSSSFAGVPGNRGTTDGLHSRRFPAVRRADTWRQPDRCLLAAKHRATLGAVPRGVRFKCNLKRERTAAIRTAAGSTRLPI